MRLCGGDAAVLGGCGCVRTLACAAFVAKMCVCVRVVLVFVLCLLQRCVCVRVLSSRVRDLFCAACVVKPRVGRRMSQHAMTHTSVCDVCWDVRVCISLCQCGLGVRGRGGCCLCCLCVWGVCEEGESVLFLVCIGAVLGAQDVFGTWCVCMCLVSARACAWGGG